MSWFRDYKKKVLACRDCSAREECTQPVPGIGNPGADVVLIGRNPGRQEDERGEPFVGKAGLILDNMLMELDWDRSSVFITNLCLCHTKDNRNLMRDEVATCVPRFLMPTILAIKPKLVVVFGQQPNYFLNGVASINKNLGKVIEHKHFRCYSIVSIHPAAVTYRQSEYKKLQTVMRKAYNLLCELSKND